MLHQFCRQITSLQIWYFVRLKSQKHGTKKLLEMPKNKKHVEEAQKERIRIKEKNAKYSPGTVNIQILGSGAPGSPASVYLFTDQTRYLFNCGEGTQRLAHEHKTKLARLEHIFMTRTCWERVGGLPGLSLTLQDAGVPNLTLHGPSGLAEIFSGMRRFVVLKHLRVDYVNCEHGGRFEDEVMNVTYIPLKKSSNLVRRSEKITHSAPLQVDETDYYAHERRDVQQSPLPAISSEKEEENVIMCYVCKLKPRPGMLNLEKCVEFGVPPGPLLGQLKNGFDVILENGSTVHADDVRGATDPGAVFIFIDIPNEDYLKALEDSSEIFEKYQATAIDPCNVASVVIHFSPPAVFETELYKQFINTFSPSTKHLVLNSTNNFSGYLAVHRIQWQLNLVDKDIFPIIKENVSVPTLTNERKKIKLSSDNIPVKHLEKAVETKKDNLCLDPVSALTYYHLRPRKGLDRSMEVVLRPEDYINESKAIEGFSQSLSELEQNLKKVKSLRRHNSCWQFPKIIFLGTGSCIPNKTRNVSAILMQTSDQSFVLLDCGEGTWGQIIRFFGQEAAVQVLRNLKAVYISHLHADHHIGLLGIFKAREDIFGQNVVPLILLAPKQIQSWLTLYDYKIESIQNNYQLVPNGDLLTQPLVSPDLSRLGISSIRTCLVRHCPHAFGVSFELDTTLRNEPIKITYSGDTMPCDDLIELGMNSTILIHEATMEDDLINEAKMKMHSTISQAVQQGVKMNAQYTILTHFSQRYAKLPRIETDLACNIGIAFDNMQLTVPDLECMHMMYPTLKILFSEHCGEMEQKAVKRALKKERRKSPLKE